VVLIIGIFTLNYIALIEASDISLAFNFNKNLIIDNLTTNNNSVDSTNSNNTQPLLCNGDGRFCDLRYDQTYPGTHNSAAYNLRFDCEQTIRRCKDSTEICTRQYAQCLGNYKVQCDAQTSQCKQFNPNWINLLCDGFNNVCKTSNAICYAWNIVCKGSGNACNIWGDACNIKIPDWVLTCFWENNPGYDLTRQLKDGIRLFDLDTCLINGDNERVVLCHGMGLSRALGQELDTAFKAFRDFIDENPNEIITLEFGDIDGNGGIISNYLQNKLAEYFIDSTTGHILMYTMNSDTTWPTLREMIQNNQRIVIFFGTLYNQLTNKVNWIQYTDDWFTDSYTYTSNATTYKELVTTFTNWCQNSVQVIQNDEIELHRPRWQTVDATIGLALPQINDDLLNKVKQNGVCIRSLARSVNFDVLDVIANECAPRFTYIYRVRIDYYWQSNLFEVVNRLNEMNLKKYIK
ncbi:10566_t:CDS:2, partial [Entrophospora sp. SA101]